MFKRNFILFAFVILFFNIKLFSEYENVLPDKKAYHIYSVDNNLIVCTNYRLFLSSDNGNTWKSINNGLPGVFIISFIKLNDLYFVGTEQGVYKSTDYGNNWIKSNEGIPNDVLIDQFAIQGNYIYASSNYYFTNSNICGLYRSSDFGATWTDVPIDKRSEYANYQIVAKIAANDKYFFLATEGGIWRSGNHGDNWEYLSENWEFAEDMRTMFLVDSLIFGGACTGGNYLSTNNGDTWIANNSNPDYDNIITMKLNKFCTFQYPTQTINVSDDTAKSWNKSIEINFLINDMVIHGDYLFFTCDDDNNKGIYRVALQPTSSINESKADNSIVINQYYNHINIYTINNQILKSITLYNSDGYFINNYNELNTNFYSINTNTITNGMYFLMIKDDKSERMTKIIINK